MKKYMNVIIILVLVITSLLGCDTKKNSNSSNKDQQTNFGVTVKSEDYDINSSSVEELIQKGLEQRLKKKINTKDLVVDYPYYEGSSYFTTFYVKNGKNIELGILYAEWEKDHYSLQQIDLNPVNDNDPLSVISTTGQLIGGKTNFKVIYGYIFDKDINEVQVEYKNNNINAIKIENKKTFIDVVTGKKILEKSISARSKDNKVIFEYTY